MIGSSSAVRKRAIASSRSASSPRAGSPSFANSDAAPVSSMNIWACSSSNPKRILSRSAASEPITASSPSSSSSSALGVVASSWWSGVPASASVLPRDLHRSRELRRRSPHQLASGWGRSIGRSVHPLVTCWRVQPPRIAKVPALVAIRRWSAPWTRASRWTMVLPRLTTVATAVSSPSAAGRMNRNDTSTLAQ